MNELLNFTQGSGKIPQNLRVLKDCSSFLIIFIENLVRECAF